MFSLGTLPILPLCVVFHPVLRHSFHLVDIIIIIIIIIIILTLSEQDVVRKQKGKKRKMVRKNK